MPRRKIRFVLVSPQNGFNHNDAMWVDIFDEETYGRCMDQIVTYLTKEQVMDMISYYDGMTSGRDVEIENRVRDLFSEDEIKEMIKRHIDGEYNAKF